MIPPEIILKRGKNASKFHVTNRLTMAHYHKQRKETQEYKKPNLFFFFTFPENLNSYQILFCYIIWLYSSTSVQVSR